MKLIELNERMNNIHQYCYNTKTTEGGDFPAFSKILKIGRKKV